MDAVRCSFVTAQHHLQHQPQKHAAGLTPLTDAVLQHELRTQTELPLSTHDETAVSV